MENKKDKMKLLKTSVLPACTKFLFSMLFAFSIAIIVLTITGIFFGEEAKESSSFYQLGKEGIAYSSILQWLAASCVMAVIGMIIHSEKISKKLMAFWRYGLSSIFIILTVVIFSACFDWFPLDDPTSWITFLLCYGVCFAFIYLLTSVKTRSEGKLYDKLLEDYKNSLKETDLE